MLSRRSFFGWAGAAVAALVIPWRKAKAAVTPNVPTLPQTCTWTGDVSTEWTDPRNWLDGKVPRNGDDIVVRQCRFALYGSPATVRNLCIYPGGKVATCINQIETFTSCNWNVELWT